MLYNAFILNRIAKEIAMKRTIWILTVLILLFLSACAADSTPSPLEDAAQKIEQALPEGYEKDYQVQVHSYSFLDEQGNTIEYFLCITTYASDAPKTTDGLHKEALCAVFDVDNTPVITKLDGWEYPAAIYQDEEFSYLCWTATPEVSAILKYAAGTISENDAKKILESVFTSPNA